jgi:Uri superfamily endonuclease
VKGVYYLVLELEKDSRIRVGKRTLFFGQGSYVYVGSALNNLEKRIRRHLSTKKALHWHIDYFSRKARIVGYRTFETTKRMECLLSRKVEALADDSVAGFGCSDCRCRSHLHYFATNPQKRLGTQVKLLKGS